MRFSCMGALAVLATASSLGPATAQSGVQVGVLELFAPTRDIGPGDLAGNYSGVTAGAAVGLGGNANVLVGGSNSSIALQPLSLQGQTGLNLAVGVAALELRP